MCGMWWNIRYKQAYEMELLTPYRSANIEQIVERFQDPAKMKVIYISYLYGHFRVWS